MSTLTTTIGHQVFEEKNRLLLNSLRAKDIKAQQTNISDWKQSLSTNAMDRATYALAQAMVKAGI